MVVKDVKATVAETWYPNEAGSFEPIDGADYSAEQRTVSEIYRCTIDGKRFRKLEKALAHAKEHGEG